MVGVTLALVLSPWLRQATGIGTTHRRGYLPGQLVDIPRELFQNANRTVVLFLSSSCNACQRAAPALRTVIAELSAHRDVKVLMVTGRSRPEDDEAFAESLGIDAGQVAQLDFRTLRLISVPTLLATDSSGLVLHVLDAGNLDHGLREFANAVVRVY